MQLTRAVPTMSRAAPSGFAAAFVLLDEVAGPSDRILLGGRAAAALSAGAPQLVCPPGQALAEATGLAWAARQAGSGLVHLLVSSDELGANGDLASHAVAEGLGNLRVVVHAAEADQRAEDRMAELGARGWLTQTVGAHQREAIAAALRRPSAGRPSILYCLGMRRPSAAAPDAVRAALAARGSSLPAPRRPIVVAPEGGTGEVGAFALGVALHGSYVPMCSLPLDEAFALTPMLRRAGQLRLPLIVVLSRDGDEPADALPALRLIPGLVVARSVGLAEALSAGGPHALVE